MTTTIKIGSAGAGRDYATLQSAWNALPSTLGDDYVFELYNDSEFTAGLDTSVSGKVVGSHTVTIRPATGHGFRDHADKLTNSLRYNQSHGVAISASVGAGAVIAIYASGIVLDGLQVRNTYSGECMAVFVNDATFSPRISIKNCILQANSAVESTYFVVVGRFADIYNNAIIQNGNGGGLGGNDIVAKGNTIIAVGGSSMCGVRSNWNAMIAIDNAVFGFSTPFDKKNGGSYNETSDYNATSASSTGTGTGTHNVVDLVSSDQFLEGSSLAYLDLRIKSGSALAEAGVADADIQADILGTTRYSPPTIGAIEYAASIPVITLSPKPTTVSVGSARTETVSRNTAAPSGGVTYNLSSNATAVATVPATAVMAEGQTTKTFDITGVSIGDAVITATNAADSNETDSVAVTVTAATVRTLQLLAHVDAVGATSVKGAVFAAPTGGALTGAKIGEFSGQAFDGTAVSGQARLRVAASLFGGGALTTSDVPVIVWTATSASGSALGNGVAFGSVGPQACTVVDV